MSIDCGGPRIFDQSESNYDDWIIETESIQEMMMDVQTYDDYFVDG
jgi:hypothetical protein